MRVSGPHFAEAIGVQLNLPSEGAGYTFARLPRFYCVTHKSQLEKKRLEKKQLDLREAALSP